LAKKLMGGVEMGQSVKGGSFGKGQNAEPSKKGDSVIVGKHGLAEGRAPPKKAPAAEEGASKKMGTQTVKR
jgi:hypothetical protein